MYKEESRFTKHLAPYWGETKLEDITTKDIFIYQKNLVDLDLSPQSVRLCLSLLRRILNRAKQFELYTEKKKVQFEMPVCDNRRLRFLTQEETSELLFILQAKSELWYDITLFALHTGMRAGEIFSLKNQCISFQQKSLVVFDPKNSENRIVPLNAISLNIAQKYVQKKYAYTFSKIKIKEVSQIFRDAVKSTSINENITDRRSKFVFHSLRHTFASWLVQRGIPILVVSKLLGHKSLQMTMRYAHLAPDQGHHAVAIIENEFIAYLDDAVSICQEDCQEKRE